MKPLFIRLTHYLIILVCILFVISLVRNFTRTRSMQITLLEAEKSLEELYEKQKSLQGDLEKVEGDFYIEQQARNKLGLVKENEVVVVLPSKEVLRNLSPWKEKNKEYSLPNPNWKKWVKLFF